MKEITSHAPGSFCWVELATSNSQAAKQFYTELFGWTVNELPMGPDMVYTMLQLNGKEVGALYQQDDQQKSSGIPPNWLSYVSVSKVDDAVEKAKSLGGTVVVAPLDVMDAGRMAVLQDPVGAAFAIWQPGKSIGARYVNEPGSFCWNELMTTDEKKAGDFYSRLFGWGKEAMDMGPSGQYTMFQNGERPAGGMLRITPEMGNVPPNWLVYFAVNDCDQTASKAQNKGGTVIVPPSDIPNIGRFSVLLDPQSAAFAIIKLANPQT